MQLAYIADDSGRLAPSHIESPARWETLCVATPVN